MFIFEKFGWRFNLQIGIKVHTTTFHLKLKKKWIVVQFCKVYFYSTSINAMLFYCQQHTIREHYETKENVLLV